MINYQLQITETLGLFVLAVIIAQFVKKGIKKFALLKNIDANRKKVILNLSYFLFYILTLFALLIIWGIGLKQFTIFVSSILAVLGIGFFAQWSILSNLTASVILFFYHPVRIGDTIRIIDKEFDFTGDVIDITGFYFHLKTKDGQNITLPNSLVMQKAIQML